MYRARQPSRAQVAIAVAICPPGSRANRWSRCLVFFVNYTATTETRSMLFNPNPTTSKGLLAAGGMANGILKAK